MSNPLLTPWAPRVLKALMVLTFAGACFLYLPDAVEALALILGIK